MQVHFVPKKLQATTLNYVILNSKFAKAEFQSVFLLKLDTILIDLHQESVWLRQTNKCTKCSAKDGLPQQQQQQPSIHITHSNNENVTSGIFSKHFKLAQMCCKVVF